MWHLMITNKSRMPITVAVYEVHKQTMQNQGGCVKWTKTIVQMIMKQDKIGNGQKFDYNEHLKWYIFILSIWGTSPPGHHLKGWVQICKCENQISGSHTWEDPSRENISHANRSIHLRCETDTSLLWGVSPDIMMAHDNDDNDTLSCHRHQQQLLFHFLCIHTQTCTYPVQIRKHAV